MDFKYSNDQCWVYTFTLNEKRPTFVEVNYVNDSGDLMYSDIIPFRNNEFVWDNRLRSDLISKEAKEYCEKSVKSYMKLKAFW